MNWFVAAGQILAAILAAGGTGAAVAAVASRPKTKADAAGRLTDSAIKVVQEVRAEAAAARKETADARREAAEARVEIRTMRAEAATLADQVAAVTAQLRRLVGWIHEPAMTIERLRLMVPLEPHSNGHG